MTAPKVRVPVERWASAHWHSGGLSPCPHSRSANIDHRVMRPHDRRRPTSMMEPATSTQKVEDPDLGSGVSPFEITRHRRWSHATPRSMWADIDADPPGLDTDPARHRRSRPHGLRRGHPTSTLQSSSSRSMWGYIDDGVECPHRRCAATSIEGSGDLTVEVRDREHGVGILAVDVGPYRRWGRVSSRSRCEDVERGVGCPHGRRVRTSSVGSVSSRSTCAYIARGAGVPAIDGR